MKYALDVMKYATWMQVAQCYTLGRSSRKEL